MLDDLAVTDSAAYAEMAKAGAEALVSVRRFELAEVGGKTEALTYSWVDRLPGKKYHG